jgi:hypothetical protein
LPAVSKSVEEFKERILQGKTFADFTELQKTK